MSAVFLTSLLFSLLIGSNGVVREASDSLSTRIVVDQDGNQNSVRQFGSQWWFVNNLRVRTYANGDPIEYVTDASAWADLEHGALSAYNHDESLVEQIGYLYNWFAVMDERGVCPAGWNVPTDEDWFELEQHLGMSPMELDGAGMRGAGANVGGVLKDTSAVFWAQPNEGAVNTSGFNGLGSGMRLFNGNFSGMGRTGFWWTSSHRNTGGLYPNRVWVRFLSHHGRFVSRISAFMESGISVRCVSGEQ